ncbi:MAG TPA: oxidoreductase [Pseudonocardiaceae bacterium]|jgi:NAD(P)-dependent dehydrogenase (short-subunit alcohol dehydrogenase family)|nr:oxidoreductase [Pseudonocardiaceae bacterium]
MVNWTAQDIPDQSGRTVLITGANSGLGLRSAQLLAEHNARVLLACRSAERGKAALATMPGGNTELIELDLADLSAVRRAADEVRERTGDQLDVLINNAGVMFTPRRQTADGFELQYGTNYLGHVALTWRLMPALRGRPGARIVTLSSLLAHAGRINLADPNYQHRRYTSVTAYGQSKLANQLFAAELDRRLRAAGQDTLSMAAHPGYTGTNLGANSARSWSGALGAAMATIYQLGNQLISQSVDGGVLPMLYAATAPDVRGGAYYGPSGFQQMYGMPREVPLLAAARNPVLLDELWSRTAELTGVAPDPA